MQCVLSALLPPSFRNGYIDVCGTISYHLPTLIMTSKLSASLVFHHNLSGKPILWLLLVVWESGQDPSAYIFSMGHGSNCALSLTSLFLHINSCTRASMKCPLLANLSTSCNQKRVQTTLLNSIDKRFLQRVEDPDFCTFLRLLMPLL